MENKKLFNISRILVDSLIVIFVLASTLMMAFKGQGTLASKGVEMFKYYTVDSNILMGIAALIKIYFDIEITLGKIQKVPLWSHLLYSRRKCSLVFYRIDACRSGPDCRL